MGETINPNPSHAQQRDEPMSQPPITPHAADQPRPNNTEINNPDLVTKRVSDTGWGFGNDSLDDFENNFREYEEDYRQYLDENYDKSEEWWDESKRKMRNQMREMRGNIDRVREKGGSAWEEAKEGMHSTLQDIQNGYEKTVRELRK